MADHVFKIPPCCLNHPHASNRSDRRVADRLCPCRGECSYHPGDLVDAETIELFRWLLFVAMQARPGGLAMAVPDVQAERVSDQLVRLATTWGVPVRRTPPVIHLGKRQVIVVPPGRESWLRGVTLVGLFLGDVDESTRFVTFLRERLRAPGAHLFRSSGHQEVSSDA